MKKRVLKMSLAAVLLMNAVPAFAISVGVTNGDNAAVVSQIIESKNIDKAIDRANALDKYIEQYILITGKTPNNIKDLESKFGLSDSALQNYNGSLFGFSIDTDNYTITIKNIINPANSYRVSSLINLIKNSSEIEPTASVKINRTPSGWWETTTSINIVYPMSPKLVGFLTKLNSLNKSDVIISETNPSALGGGDFMPTAVGAFIPCSTTKLWVKPTGDGNFITYKCIAGNWKNVGSLKAQGIVVNSPQDLTKYNDIAQIGTKAYVRDGDGLDTYVFDGTSWKEVSSGIQKNKVYNISNLPTCNVNDSGQIIYVKDSSGSVTQDICDGAGHWLNLSTRSELEKKLYSDKSDLPTCTSDLSGLELFVKKSSDNSNNPNVVGYICDGKGDWVANNNTPANAVIIPSVWGQQDFDDNPQFKSIIGKNIPFCDSAKPHHCFKNWNDFISKSVVYKRIGPLSNIALMGISAKISYSNSVVKFYQKYGYSKWYKMNDYKQYLLYKTNILEGVIPYALSVESYMSPSYDYKIATYDSTREICYAFFRNLLDKDSEGYYSIGQISFPCRDVLVESNSKYVITGALNDHITGPDVWYVPKGDPAPPCPFPFSYQCE